MTPDQRAKAIVEHFAASLPPAVRPELQSVITRAITRAVHQELAWLERRAKADAESALGKGKSARGQDLSARHWHQHWAETFRMRRKGSRSDDFEQWLKQP